MLQQWEGDSAFIPLTGVFEHLLYSHAENRAAKMLRQKA